MVRFCTWLAFSSTIWLSRLGGSGGKNCQWITASPSDVPQNPTCATRKSPCTEGLDIVPEEKAMEPGGSMLVPKTQGTLVLHTSFCSTVSKEVVSGVTVSVTIQPLEATSTFWSMELVKVR